MKLVIIPWSFFPMTPRSFVKTTGQTSLYSLLHTSIWLRICYPCKPIKCCTSDRVVVTMTSMTSRIPTVWRQQTTSYQVYWWTRPCKATRCCTFLKTMVFMSWLFNIRTLLVILFYIYIYWYPVHLKDKYLLTFLHVWKLSLVLVLF